VGAFLNKVFRKLDLPIMIRRHFDHRQDMMSMEQASNLQLLMAGVLGGEVPGAVVELGCYTGSTSLVLAKVLERSGGKRPFHVFDSFAHELGSEKDIRAVFESNFTKYALPLPAIHQGDLRATVPAELPANIAFAHIDLGVGGGTDIHTSIITYALETVYPRLSKHGVMVFMDYHVPGVTVEGSDSNPGVRLACDAFLAERPERMNTLYGGACSHGYFRKD
jgi:O-methyltransferase